jgi:hypothetical protein
MLFLQTRYVLRGCDHSFVMLQCMLWSDVRIENKVTCKKLAYRSWFSSCVRSVLIGFVAVSDLMGGMM